MPVTSLYPISDLFYGSCLSSAYFKLKIKNKKMANGLFLFSRDRLQVVKNRHCFQV